ncbi:2Fe-2S iron-sulfur cluster-binding protein [Natronomonas sp. EA1]|uniref:2Fe-2S iron-sulfur cluster-binding protein n=1 Tax=Natronomonas sp. EA1 TaxID=3421655 RepID=UPI003EC0A08E
MVRVTVHDGTETTTLDVPAGTNLRAALLDADIDPYGTVSGALNCGGRGLCGTCGVRIDEESAPAHWHDRAAERWGYPRLSCTIEVTQPLTVRLVDGKIMWGQLLPD